MDSKSMDSTRPVDSCDTLLKNAVVWRGSKPKPEKVWLAISGNIFSAIGDENTPVPERCGQVFDLRGKQVLPGFVDCHSHLSAAAYINYAGDASRWRSKEQALSAIRSDANLVNEGNWLIYFYADWTTWAGRKIPSAKELDDASGGRPVFLVCTSLHRGILSESALKEYEISHMHKQHWSRFIDTDRGVPTGVVWEECFSYCLMRSLQERWKDLGALKVEQNFLKEAQKHLSLGICDVHDPGVTSETYPLMVDLGDKTPLRISWSTAGDSGAVSTASKENSFEQYGTGPSSAKVFTDGAHHCSLCVSSATAARMALFSIFDVFRTANLNPVRNLLETKSTFKDGKVFLEGAIFEKEALNTRVKELSKVNARLKIHAIGNNAIDMTCDCIVENGLTSTVCLEHALLVDDQNIEKISKNNILVSMQPGFLPHHGPLFSGINAGKAIRGLAASSMLDADINVIFSSDYPCAPLDPLHNMRRSVDRKTSDGHVYLESEGVSPEQAVYAYTVGGMKGITGQAKNGIEVGEVADFIILSADPFEESSIVESTWIEGRCVYSGVEGFS